MPQDMAQCKQGYSKGARSMTVRVHHRRFQGTSLRPRNGLTWMLARPHGTKSMSFFS